MRAVLIAFILFLALAIAGSAQRAQQGAIPPVAPLPAAPRSTPDAKEPVAKEPAAPMETVEGYDNIVRPFVIDNCVPCHGYKKQKNGLNLESFENAASLTDDHDRWSEVVKKLRSREMPPEEEPQPPEHQRQAVAGWLAKELERIDKSTPPDPGRVTARRLNRTEYNNTVRDLLGVDDLGGTMRLGSYPCELKAGSLSRKLYGQPVIHERHRHRYEFNCLFEQSLCFL